jgi:pimeloyl-ACP methyl ester carboxylesterase
MTRRLPLSPQETHYVLIRGLIRSRFHWHEFPNRLLRQDGVSNVVLPELAGNGERWNKATPHGIHAMMEDIRQQSRSLLPDPMPPVRLVAVSMGAMIATEWARCYPQEVQQLHLINTSFGTFSHPWQRMQLSALVPLLRHFRILPEREATIAQYTLRTPLAPARLQQWIAFARKHPVSLRNTLIQIASASRYRGLPHAPCEHTRIYSSPHDQLVSHRCSNAIAQHWNVPLMQHPDAGHDLPLDDPEWLVKKILQPES